MRKKLTDLAKKKLKDSVLNSPGGNDKDRHAATVIRNHVVWSMGASYVIPLPVADVFAVSALQLDMIRQLCRVYDIDFAETQGKAIVSALTTSTMTRAGARSLLKMIPVVGTIIGGVTVAAFNGASTYALGEVFRRHFSGGGTFLDFDTDRLKKLYFEQFEKGKRVAEQWRSEEKSPPDTAPYTDVTPPPPGEAPRPAAAVTEPPATKNPAAAGGEGDEALRKLRELAELRAQNILTQEEFEAMKKKIIGG